MRIISGKVHKFPTTPAAAQAMLRRKLLAESADLAEQATAQLRELQDLLDGSDDAARLDFTRLSAIRVQVASLATTARKLRQAPFQGPFQRNARIDQ